MKPTEKRQIYASVFGAMIARQAQDFIEEGRGAATDADMDRFIMEADAVATMTLDAIDRDEMTR